MNYKKLFEIQKQLKENIAKHHPKIKDDTEIFNKLILSLNVEIGEIANEVRCFKFWSTKPPSPKEVILEEFVDALHFVLELGIELGEEIEKIYYHDIKFQTLTDDFNELYTSISKLNRYRNSITYQILVCKLFALGKALGFNEEEIEDAYLKKNAVNHRRQQEGY